MCDCNENIFSIIWNLDWEKISSILVIIGGVYAIFQYRLSVKSNIYTVYHDIKNEIYTGDSKIMSRAIRTDQVILKLKQDGTPVLCNRKPNEVLTSESEATPIMSENDTTLSLDLLHNLEDLYLYYSDGIISKKHIIFGFGHNISRVQENSQVKLFIQTLRNRENEPELYIGIEKLYDLIKE